MKKTLTALLFIMLSLSSFAEIAHGTCGEELTWSLSDDYTLTIDGEGKMHNWTYSFNVPWDSYRSQIRKLSIGERVTSIGGYAFYGCSGLTSVTIPNSVTSIGNGAFHSCSGLTSLTIPNSVTNIGEAAFSNCSGLTSVTIPNSVTSIGSSAFYGCSGLTSVTISNSVTSIGKWAFENCSGLTSVTIPNSVTSIGDYAFRYCSGLTSVTIPNSVTSIGDHAFFGCSSLTSLTIPNSVTSIGDHAFYGCSRLTSVTVDADNPYYCSEDNVIYTKDKTTLVYCMTSKKGDFVIPNSVTSIGDYAFYDCSSLTSVTIPNSVTSIGDYAFDDCSGLTSVTIPNYVTSIGDYAFDGCSGLTSVTIPNSVTSIGNGAFYKCSGLTSVTIPNSVTSIGYSAFYYCNNIKILHCDCTVKYPDLSSSMLRELYIGDNVEIIYSFFNPYYLQKVVLGKNVKYIRNEAFKGCKYLKEFYITGTEVPYLYPDVFTNAVLSNATLYVPKEKAAYYKTTEPWSQFGKILDLEGNEPPVTKKCAMPSIAYEDGKLYFSTETPDADVESKITVSDAKTTTGNVVSLNATYDITAFAKRSEYENSDVATATLHWMTGTMDIATGTQKFDAKRAILVSSSDGFVNVSGLSDGEKVEVYSTDGKLLNTVYTAGNAANIAAKVGDTIILKIHGETIKVLVK